jgi:UDP-glucose 6-dehydrogenase
MCWQKYGKHIVFQPEFLGETPQHPLLNQKVAPFIILGGDPEDTRKLIELYTTVYNASLKIRQMTALEAEIVKLCENRAIAYKVIQHHELYEILEKAKVDYYKIRDAVYGDDPRFNLWFSFIYPNNLGFNSSKCLNKDVPAFCAWAEKIGYDPKVTKALIEKSNEYEKNQTH